MLADQILERKGRAVSTVPPDATVRDALSTLADVNVGALIVSPDGSALAGIVSERDIVRRLAVDGVWRTSSKKPVRNQDLWITLAEEVGRHTSVDWFRVPGHSGIELNERVDVEAVNQRDLFSRRAR